ncbi:MAG: heavy-metal-associated domain-containing protein [Clostridiaceae bacterium]|jgi:copper chaperone CopZ|nr:heavy-metal-associated domain-containing protein [Clostridiaceae bacterium]NLC89929.1 heavy-metal-associated domain-containing protein [Clostridiaceae bacterium]
MTNKTLQLEGMTCPTCVLKIEKLLQKTKGVEKSEVLYNSGRVKLTFDENIVSADAISAAIEQLGYVVVSVK